MFFGKQDEKEFFEELESNLLNNHNLENSLLEKRKEAVLEYLNDAAFLLKSAGLNEEVKVLCKLAQEVYEPASTEGLTSEKMLHNLEEKGWVFNADDGVESEDESQKTLEVEEPEA